MQPAPPCPRIVNVIKRKTQQDFWERHADAKGDLTAWFHEAKHAKWTCFAEIKARYASADILPGNRVAFNIHGNTYRLIVRFDYKCRIAFIRFVGTHAEYDKINAETI